MYTTEVDPTTGEYVTYDANGNEVSRFSPDTAFQGLNANTASSNTTAIGSDGKAVNPRVPASDPMVAPVPTAAPAAPTGTAAPAGPRSSTGYSPSRGRNYGSGGGYSGGGTDWVDNSYGGSDPFAGGGSDFPNYPKYADGSMHPSQGGAPRVPGGMWNTQQDGGYDNRQQVYVPGGAAAGPFETRAAPTPEGGMTGNYGSQGGSSTGGAGGSNMGANSAIGQKLEAKVRGMAAKIQGGGSTSSSTTTDTTKQYRRDGRRMDKAYEAYNDQLAHPKPLPVRGWVKEQGYKPGSVSALLDEPGRVFGTEHDLNQFTDHLTDLPMTDLAMMTKGTQGRNLLSKTPITKVPGILRKSGVKPTKPDYKRMLDPSKVANTIAQMYGGNMSRFNTTDMLENMAGATKNSALRQGLRQQAEYDPGQAFSQMENYVQAAHQMDGMRGTGWSDARSRSIHRQMLEMAPTILGRKPKRMDRGIQDVANEFL